MSVRPWPMMVTGRGWGGGQAQQGDGDCAERHGRGDFVLEAVRGLVLDRPVEWSTARGNGERPKKTLDGLSRSGSAAPAMPASTAARLPRGATTVMTPITASPVSPSGHRHLHEMGMPLPPAPVRCRVEGEVRRDTEEEGGDAGGVPWRRSQHRRARDWSPACCIPYPG